MAKEFLGIGWKYPVSVDSKGKISMSEYETDIKEAIKIILGTAKGERVMRPDFGCGIHDFVFSPINKATLSLVENTVREGLTNWEPRIELIKVEAIDEASDEGKLLVSIDYRVRVTNNRFNLVYPFYLKEG
jgi:phage baseplate assembly protein W